MESSASILCHRCARVLTQGEGNFFVVRIEAVCDPSPPLLDQNEPVGDFASEWERLLNEMRGMSERELMDQVHRRMTIHLCSACFEGWIEDPTR